MPGDHPGESADGRGPWAHARMIQAYACDVAVSSMTDAPRAFHLLAKPTGAVCNLDCAYCFFLSKEMLYPGSGSGWRTSCSRRTSGS